MVACLIKHIHCHQLTYVRLLIVFFLACVLATAYSLSPTDMCDTVDCFCLDCLLATAYLSFTAVNWLGKIDESLLPADLSALD